MKKTAFTRLLSLMLVFALLAGYIVPVHATSTESSATQALHFEQIDADGLTVPLGHRAEQVTKADELLHKADETVRVSIVLEKPSTLDAGFSTVSIADNTAAMAYRQTLRDQQAAAVKAISAKLGSELQVVRSLTLAANIISATVPYGKLDLIRAVPGVVSVELEACYSPAVYSVDENDPNMATASEMIGASAVWASGYTGAGSRVAVIDTGIDTDHQSFSAEGYRYSLKQQAALHGMTEEEYTASLNLLTVDEILAHRDQLNIPFNFSADSLYVNAKIPFGFNYVDIGLEITHDHDSMGEHGSHVEGIAAANSYIPKDGSFVSALDSVHMQGVAPDAQILAMKVFGAAGGAYDSDYMAAIEDAIILGADSVNLSLGSANPGFSRCATYETILQKLTESDTVVVMSAGNSGSWADHAVSGIPYLYGDDVSLSTAGSPGSYTNALTVASVNNAGITGRYLTAGQTKIFYTETEYTNKPFITLAGTREYVLIEGTGTEEDWNALGDALTGKIAICTRGAISFYQKAEFAVTRGAVAAIVVNTSNDPLSMDLSAYTKDAPVISVTMADGAVLKNNAQAVTGEDGAVLYYAGTMEINDQISTSYERPEFFTMSDFSSWGVPGSLQLKPEITAPGGNIYSVNGAIVGGKSYETMSGTSMAAPQITGMAALVAQYIREKGLEEATGLSARVLTQSLLMSTAQPLVEKEAGSYYSVMKQGAGMADVSAAVGAVSYILMDEDAAVGAADGKVKAELGDDPQRTGLYSFGFTLNNMGTETVTYTLRSDFFTQDLFGYNGQVYLDTFTVPMAAEVNYNVNGEVFAPEAPFSCDLNKDGVTDAEDAQVILNYTVGLADTIDADLADVDGDGTVSTHDAWMLLNGLETAGIAVAPGESVHITVTAALTDDVKSYLDSAYENGAFVEGYVFAEPVSSQEGAFADAVHSIPVLGFYGNWSDAPAFDKLTYTGYLYGDETVPYTGVAQTNNLLIKYAGDSDSYWQIINPFGIEDTYPEDCGAIRSSDTLYQFRYSLIRNAAALAPVITNNDGKVLYVGEPSTQEIGAFYYTNGGSWQNTSNLIMLNKKVNTLGAAEGDTLHVSLVAIPEYYESGAELTQEDVKTLVESGVLGEGAYLTSTLVVDDTAPEITAVNKDLISGNLTISARDNEHVAAIFLMSEDGTVLASAIPGAGARGETASAFIDVSGLRLGRSIIVAAADYAYNTTYYEIEYVEGGTDYTGTMFAFTSNEYRGEGNRFVTLDPEKLYYVNADDNEGMEEFSTTGDVAVLAAEYVDGYVFMASDDGNFYVAELENLNHPQLVGAYSTVVTTVADMAFNYADGKMYVLDDANTVYTMDLTSGQLTLDHTVVSLVNPRSSASAYQKLMELAIDDDGNFYSVNYGATTNAYTYLYRWSDADVVDGQVADLAPVNNTSTGNTGYYNRYSGTLAWDHDAGVLYWANVYGLYGNNANNLLVLNTETGNAAKANATYAGGSAASYASRLYTAMTGLFVVPSGKQYVTEAKEAASLTISETEKKMLVGAEMALTCKVMPWNLSDKTVTWTSSAPEVVAVDDGFIVALSAGTATVTVTTNAEPHLTASCTVAVEDLPEIQFSGLVYGDDGSPYWADFSTANLSDWQATSGKANAYYGGGLLDDMIYVHDTHYIYGVNAETFEVINCGGISEEWIWSDAAPAPLTEDGYFGYLIALGDGGCYMEIVDAENAALSFFNMTSLFQDDPMAAIAYAGSGTHSTEAYPDCPACFYYVVTENGNLYYISMFGVTEDGVNIHYSAAYKLLGNIGLTLGPVSAVTAGAYASLLYDADSGLLLLANYFEGDSANLYAIDPETCLTVQVGDFGSDVWPVVSLYQYQRATKLTVRVKPSSVSLYEADTAALRANVYPASFQGGVTWSSSNPEVAAVDENGVVTGIAGGTAVITATSVDVNEAGEHVSASVNVSVVGLDHVTTTVHAQVTENGQSHWVTINTADLTSYTVDAEASTMLTGGGAHGGKLYGTNSNFEDDSCDIIEIDPANGYAETKVSDCTLSNAMLDLSTAPSISYEYPVRGSDPVQLTGFGMPVYLSASMGINMVTDITAGTMTNYDMRWYYQDMAAWAFAGMSTYSIGTFAAPSADFYVLEANGNLMKFQIVATSYSEAKGITYQLRRDVVGNVGKSFSDYLAMSMTYIHDDVNNGLLVADASNGAAMYYINLDDPSLHCGKLGNLAGASFISSLYTDSDLNASTIPTEGASFRTGTASCSSDRISITDHVDGWVSQASAEATGSLNAVRGEVTVDRTPVIHEDVSAANGSVDIVLTETEASTNGLVEIRYDSSALTFVGADAIGVYHAVRAEEGVIRFAYASLEAVEAGQSLAVLHFTYENGYVNTTVSVKTLERGEALSLEETSELTILREDDGHHYELVGAAEATCTENGYTGDQVCSVCGDKVEGSEVSALGHDWNEWEVVTEATETEDGLKSHTCARCEETETEVVPAVECPSAAFTDVDASKWYHAGIDFVVDHGYMAGLTDTEFGINGNVSRAQLVTILYSLAGKPSVEGIENPFTDVADGKWYTDAILWAVSEGITSGTSATAFNPNDTVNRAQIAMFLYAYAGKPTVEEDHLADFEDAAAIPAYAKAAMNWAVAEGLISGTDETHISPKTVAKRAQVATIIMNFMAE